MKPSRLSQHLVKINPDKTDTDATFFQSLWDNFKRRKTSGTMFLNLPQKNDDGLLASNNLSFMIARKGKLNMNSEELILPSVKEVLDTVLRHPTSSAVIKSVPSSNNTVQRRTDELDADIKDKFMQHNQEYRIQSPTG